MDFKQTLKEELQLLQGRIYLEEYVKISYLLTMEYAESLQLTIEELEEHIGYMKSFQTKYEVSEFINSWIDNMIDNFNFAINKLKGIEY